MTLNEIKIAFLENEINPVKLSHLLKLHKETLSKQYPNVENSLAQFYLYIHDLPEDISYCKRSGNNRRLCSTTKGFMKFCGNESVCECNKENSSNIRLEKTPVEKELTKSKRAKTNLQKYGAEFASKTETVKEKAAATCIERYGTPSPTQNPLIFAKVKETTMENWGVEHPHQHPELARRAEDTWLQTRGVSRPVQDPNVKNKMVDTMIERYGIEHNMHDPQRVATVRTKNRTRQYTAVLQSRLTATPLFSVNDFIDGDSHTSWTWKCNNCQTVFQQPLRAGKDVRCLECNPLGESNGEYQLRSWLEANNIQFIKNDRTIIKPYELDFYLPDLNIAIEFNGIWWHSERVLSNRKYHFDKYQMALKQDVKLIQIWEHDLHNKKDIIFQRLAHSCGLSATKIGARSCNIRVIPIAVARQFLNQYHLQGWYPSGNYWGCFYLDQLVAVVSIGKNRFNKKADYELTRFATKSGMSITGILSKMLKETKTQLGDYSLITYADLCWGRGNVYEKSGFTFDSYSEPNYWYFKNLDNIKSRMALQKHKIAGSASGQSESEIAEALGYNRFFDAGNSIWLRNV